MHSITWQKWCLHWANGWSIIYQHNANDSSTDICCWPNHSTIVGLILAQQSFADWESRDRTYTYWPLCWLQRDCYCLLLCSSSLLWMLPYCYKVKHYSCNNKYQTFKPNDSNFSKTVYLMYLYIGVITDMCSLSYAALCMHTHSYAICRWSCCILGMWIDVQWSKHRLKIRASDIKVHNWWLNFNSWISSPSSIAKWSYHITHAVARVVLKVAKLNILFMAAEAD